MKPSAAQISNVLPGSIAAEVGLVPGDILVSINGQPVVDIIDYQYLTSADHLVLLVRNAAGEYVEAEIEKDATEELGLRFDAQTFDGVRRCTNKCSFCFIDQNPPGLRPSLYVRDDDYRLSFLQGHFVTLTNLRRQDWDRIFRLRLSPLYVSVHTTDGDLRARMLGTKAASHIKEQLIALRDHGITVHTQIVLCPGVNDGEYLWATLDDLAALHPAVASVAVVPFGSTRYRTDLAQLGEFTAAEVAGLAKDIHKRQKEYLGQLGTRFTWLADEFYLTYGLPLPSRPSYEDMPQTDNGVGLSRQFLADFQAAWRTHQRVPRRSEPLSIATGVLGARVLAGVVERLRQIGVDVQLWPIPNEFYGATVSASGLVTGSDLIAALKGRMLGSELLIPTVMVRDVDSEQHFLDAVTLAQVAAELKVPVTAIADAAELVDYLVK